MITELKFMFDSAKDDDCGCEERELKLILNRKKYFSILWEVDQWLRNQIKYGCDDIKEIVPHDINEYAMNEDDKIYIDKLSEKEKSLMLTARSHALQTARDKLWEEMRNEGVDLDE